MHAKKFPLILCHTDLIFLSFNKLNILKLIELIDFNNSSYIPVINAIVPPETPGTISAAPIAIPLSNNFKYSDFDLFKL